MSNNVRKMKKEIDLTYRKVDEGLDIFEKMYEKIYDTEEQKERQRIASDLKKELKKLQRCRESIKGWLSNSSLKDCHSKLRDTKRYVVSFFFLSARAARIEREREKKRVRRAGVDGTPFSLYADKCTILMTI